ncbi:MAG: DUF1800 family protein [Cytophagales bacterium]
MALAKYNGTLGAKKAAHLLRRATFGPTKAAIESFASKTAPEAFTMLTATVAAPLPPSDVKTGISWLPKPNENTNSEGFDLDNFVKCWWLDQMLNSGDNLTEKMVFLFHTFFPTIDSAVGNATSLYYQNALFRFYAFGNIKTLTKKICVDNAMLSLLDGRLNEVGLPNENFARELFELHTVGRGPQVSDTDFTNYTEADIQVAARILSGWTNDNDFGTIISDPLNPSYTSNVDVETGIPLGILKGNGIYASRHYASANPSTVSERTFSAAFGNKLIEHKSEDIVNGRATKESAKLQVDELVDMIFEQRATALNFCRKIYRYFVYWKITDEVETAVISSMADTFVANNFEILPVIKELFESEYFYDAQNAIETDNTHADIIKSPLELSLGVMRFFNVKAPLPTASLLDYYDFYGGLLGNLANQGISLYEPYDVAGYDAYYQEPDFNRNWITVNTLAYRYEFALKLINNTYSDMISINLAEYVKANVADPTIPSNILKYFVAYLLPEAISDTGDGNRFDYFLDILRGSLTDINWKNEWDGYIASGLDDAINAQLKDLLAALLQTPEYQLM